MPQAVLVLGFIFFGPSVLQSAPLQVRVVERHTAAPVAAARVTLGDGLATAISDSGGRAYIHLPAGTYRLVVEHVAFGAYRGRARLDTASVFEVALVSRPFVAPETVGTAAKTPSQAGRYDLAPVEIRRAPSPSADPLRFLKVMPGVTSGNDLSNAYNVQGGNYHENLVYINGVQVELPFLVRRGLAENLSLVQPLLMDQVRFRAGAFPVQYGDRLSSVLDVGYRLPQGAWAGAVDLTGSQQQLMAGGARGAWRFAGGVRRADLGRLAAGLQTAGRFAPLFRDGQGLLRWASGGQSLAFFGLAAQSRFVLEPTDLVLRYNCSFFTAGCDEFRGRGEGHERYSYGVRAVGVNWSYKDADTELGAYVHRLRQDEREDTDVSYEIRWLPQQDEARAVGGLETRERFLSRFDLTRWTAGAQGARGNWLGGAGVRRDAYAGFTTGFEEAVNRGRIYALEDGTRRIRREPVDLFFYGQWTRPLAGGEWELGGRGVRLGATGERLFMPRLSGRYRAGGWALLPAAGLYAQPPGYRELLNVVPGRRLKAQKAWHLSLAGERRRGPSALRLEGYFRFLRDAISYRIDDLRLEYAGRNDARGHAYGVNASARGQLGRVTGIAAYSFLVAREEIEGDGRGALPRPTDQRHTFSAYIEDRMEVNWRRLEASRLHLRLLGGSGFPFTPQIKDPQDDGVTLLVDGERHSRRGRLYARFDMGMTQTVVLGGYKVDFRQEVANIFDQFNVVGYRYLPTPTDEAVELRRALGRRVYNVGMSTSFERADGG